MNIRDLQYLVAVHELKSFSKAAKKCFVSQPTLSGQLKKLEDELGASLMERTTRHVLFTPLGEAVVAKATEILITVSDIKDLAITSHDEMAGDFHIGLIPTIGPYLLPIILPKLTTQFPKLKVFLYELQTDILLNKLHKGELDAVILAKLNWDTPVNEIALYTEAMLLAVSDTHDLANDRQVQKNKLAELTMLRNQNVLMLEDGHCLRDQALGVCFSAGANEDTRFQATSVNTLLHMVSTGAGITLIPELIANRGHDGISYLRFSSPEPSREVVMLTRPKSVRIAALEKIADLIYSSVK